LLKRHRETKKNLYRDGQKNLYRDDHVKYKGGKRNAYIVLVGKLEGTRPVSRHRHRWEEDIKMVLNSVG
jgi:hypothetical protein